VARKYDGSVVHKGGRPATSCEIKELILKLARENRSWGYMATREVQIAGMVPAPNETWMKQVARNLIDPLAGFLGGTRLRIHDRASLLSEQFRELLRSAQVEGLRLPARSSNLNAYAERFVRTIRQECLSEPHGLLRGDLPATDRRGVRGAL
jgi:transposase InsO family protein